MKNIPLVITLVIVVQVCRGQDYRAEFIKSLQAEDTTQQWEVLSAWQKADPKNPELYTSYFNYYFRKSKRDLLALTTEQPQGESLSFADSTGQTVGFIGGQVSFNNQELKKGFAKIEEGIKLYPNRLDMWFGKIYALGQLGDWNMFTQEIVNVIQYSSRNKNAWLWTNNEKKEDGEAFFLSSLQSYQAQLFDSEDNALLKNMRTIALEVLKYYPNNVESLSNLSVTYLLTGDYDKALEILLKAEKINPKDVIVLGNIAHSYKEKGNKKKAIEYYKKVVKYGDEETAGRARQLLKELEG